MQPFLPSLLALAILLGVHLGSSRLPGLVSTPRSLWLSAAGGVSVAYVFLELLPEIARAQLRIVELGHLGGLEEGLFLVALLGLVCFYSLERALQRHRHENPASTVAERQIFWLHIGSFTVYNALIGYLLVCSRQALIPYTLAMALHFVVTDYSLSVEHQEAYRRNGRWVVSGGIILGWLLGWGLGPAKELWIAILIAFLGGGIILNVLKEELPEEKQSRLLAFVSGVGAYALTLLFPH